MSHRGEPDETVHRGRRGQWGLLVTSVLGVACLGIAARSDGYVLALAVAGVVVALFAAAALSVYAGMWRR